MCTCYPIINRVSELKVHIELTRFVQPEKIEIDANERAVNEKSQYCFFVCTTFDSFLNDLLGEVPVAKIVTDGTELVATEIISYCRQKLDSHKIPKRVIFCEKLEKTYNGKIKRG
jgi:acyl-CoA synthetase (AMP-forming)/AMP-acid ligase II